MPRRKWYDAKAPLLEEMFSRDRLADIKKFLDAIFHEHSASDIRPSSLVPSENLIRWIRSRKENRIMIETDGDLLQTSARIYVGLLSFA